jgi:hypothetical protein
MVKVGAKIQPTAELHPGTYLSSAEARRRTWLTRALAVALLLAGCGAAGEGRTPEGAVQNMVAAARSGDRSAVFEHLGPRTRARLAALHESTRTTGGRVASKPEDFLSVGWAPPPWEASGVRTLRQEGDRAEVEVYSNAGDRHSVEVVREGQEWKVELPGT